MSIERPSPFTIPEPTFKFAEGPPAEPPRLLGDLIRRCTLTVEAAEALPLETAMARLEGALEEGTVGPAGPPPGPRVVLRGRDEGPVVRGKPKGTLTTPQYNVVKALLDTGEAGLTKDELDRKSGHADGRKIMNRLAGSDPDWKAVLHLPGRTGGRYRIG